MTNKQNKYIDYKELINRQSFKQSLEQEGFIIIKKKPLKVIGYILICVGVLTLPFPTGSVLLIALGLSLLGLDKHKLKEKLRKKIKRFLK